MARFWSLVVAHANSHYKIVQSVPLTDENTTKFPELEIGKLMVKVDTCEFVGKVPEVMLSKIDQDNPIYKAYIEANPLPHLKAQNSELNNRILNIAEAKEHPLLTKIEQMLDAKMDNVSSAIQDRLLGKRSTPIPKSSATGPSSEQGGEETTIIVAQEIPVTSEPINTQFISSKVFKEIPSSSKINL